MFPEYCEAFHLNEDYVYGFWEGIKGDAEYTFLVFEGVELFYVDEYGNELETEIV